MDNRTTGGWGEKEIVLEVPLGLDRIVYRKKRKRQPEPNYARVQAFLLLGMTGVLIVAGLVI